MKTALYTNCALVRIPIKSGEDRYYLPQNVDWANTKIEKLVICAPDQACIDPIDGQTPVMTASNLNALDCYFTLYDSDNNEIMHDVSAVNLLHRNNNGLDLNVKLNLAQCSFKFMAMPAQDYTLLLYVYYGTREEEYFEAPKKSVTVQFPLDAAEELSFQYIINQYAHALPAKIKGIVVWSGVGSPSWITLRDYTLTYQMANIHSEMMRPDMNGGSAYDSQAAVFYLNDLDIDFDYSSIREAAGTPSTQTITFLF